MRTAQNVPATLAVIVDGALYDLHRSGSVECESSSEVYNNAIATLREVGAELRKLAAAEPTGGQGEREPLVWLNENAAEITRGDDSTTVTVHWIDGDLDEHFTEGTSWSDAITKAMAEEKAMRCDPATLTAETTEARR